MKAKKTKIPNPGSDAAIAKGCTCPVLDNCHGAGYLVGIKDVYVVTQNCPIHGHPDGHPNGIDYCVGKGAI